MSMEKRSVSIAGHQTSVSLEPEFWAHIRRLASEDGLSLAALIGEVDRARAGADAAPDRNLSSALRIFVLNRLEEEAARNG